MPPVKDFQPSPNCPNPSTCQFGGECAARNVLDNELAKNLPGKHDALESQMRLAKCTNEGFIASLWQAFRYLILNSR